MISEQFFYPLICTILYSLQLSSPTTILEVLKATKSIFCISYGSFLEDIHHRIDSTLSQMLIFTWSFVLSYNLAIQVFFKNTAFGKKYLEPFGPEPKENSTFFVIGFWRPFPWR